ncbi:hypothetical protein H1V43_33705 [Streptomyces sp. PSKA54]|uniref:Uncharacterized protein n=1 Tax=Streptomyces himalayensis subsp. aureolus TaxID=2758039 RepID=A0A7W2D7H8_9ACTN|nr:hypothetical protein [Streptomyces himalayensis]MBA4866193.1 hypothetical protein [Streptomyces himalayensis subsp. aureolus]
MKTTRNSGGTHSPKTQHNRARAWALLTEKTPGARRLPSYDSDSPGRLMDVARNYDRICQRAEGVLQPDATESEILAALLAIRMLREKLDHDELKLTTLARTKRITWARIAEWQELSGRQAAERRHLQLGRASTRPDGTVPATQSERVEYARALRSRRAERQWALSNAPRIRRVAAQLATVEDLQQRVDGSHEAHIMHAIRHGKDAPPQNPSREPLVWPKALRECVAEDERFRSAPPPPADDCLHDPEWQRQQQEADIVHRLLGLIGYAANPRNIELADLPDLVDAIGDLYNDSQQAAKSRR